MQDLGEKWGETIAEAPKPSKKEEKHYPRERFTTAQIPALKGHKVGDKIALVIEAEIVGMEKRQYGKGEEKEEYSVELKKAGIEGEAEETTSTEKRKKIADMFRK